MPASKNKSDKDGLPSDLKLPLRTPSLKEADELRRELQEVVSSIETALMKSKSPSPVSESPPLFISESKEEEYNSIFYASHCGKFKDQNTHFETSDQMLSFGTSTDRSDGDEMMQEMSRLRLRVQQLETGLSKVKSTAQSFKEERDRLKKKLREVQSARLQQGSYNPKAESSRSISPASGNSTPANQNIHIKVPLSEPKMCLLPELLSPACLSLDNNYPADQKVCCAVEKAKKAKIAEKVRLKRCSGAEEEASSIRGAELSSLGVKSSKIAEHLVSDIYEESSIQESLYGATSLDREQRCEVEFEKLKAQSGHLRSQIGLLEQSLLESRSCSDYLSSLCAQLEANQTALHLALGYSQDMDELSEALLDYFLLPSDEKGEHLRKLRLLMQKMTSNQHDDTVSQLKEQCYVVGDESLSSSGALSASTGFSCGSSCEELNSSYAKSLLRNSGDSEDLVQKIKDQVSELREAKQRVLSTVQSLELLYSKSPGLLCPPSFARFNKKRNAQCTENEKMDLENAVLIQELAALKEEKADLKATIYLLERDKEGLNLTLGGKLSELQATRLQLEQLKADSCKEGNSLEYDNEDLRARVLDMADALQTVTENADLRQKQSEQFIADLRHANDALLAAFDRTRKKQQAKVERLSEQMSLMQRRYEAQLQLLRQKQTAEQKRSSGAKKPNCFLACLGIKDRKRSRLSPSCSTSSIEYRAFSPLKVVYRC